jgi:glucokinase
MEGIKNKIILAGDLGGTHIRLSFIEILPDKNFKILQTWNKKTKDSKNLINDLLQAINDTKLFPEAIVLGIAGPVDECRGEVPILVDVPQWGKISEQDISQTTGIPKVKLMNDFVANAYGVAAIQKEDEILRVY